MKLTIPGHEDVTVEARQVDGKIEVTASWTCQSIASIDIEDATADVLDNLARSAIGKLRTFAHTWGGL